MCGSIVYWGLIFSGVSEESESARRESGLASLQLHRKVFHPKLYTSSTERRSPELKRAAAFLEDSRAFWIYFESPPINTRRFSQAPRIPLGPNRQFLGLLETRSGPLETSQGHTGHSREATPPKLLWTTPSPGPISHSSAMDGHRILCGDMDL